MLKAATAREMQKIDRTTIKNYGLSGAVLMERAGLAVVSRLSELFPRKRKNKIMVLCGGGNNGGDGFVAARILHNRGGNVDVFMAAGPGGMKGDARMHYEAAKRFGVRIHSARKFLSLRPGNLPPGSVIIDALLGTGLERDVRPPLSDVILKVNELRLPVVSIDIPSGISSDTGQVMGCAVKAQYTVTFGIPKRGHYLFPGAEFAGTLYVEDIGFPSALLRSKDIRAGVPQGEDIASMIPRRKRYSHKGTYGHVLVIAGSRGKTGAALMTARACLRTGAGLVTIGVPDTLMDVFQKRVTEEMLLPLPDKGDGTLSIRAGRVISEFISKSADVLAIGPGLSVDEEISGIVSAVIPASRIPVVMDADALNVLSGRVNILKRCKVPIILTPHTGEMARLMRQGTENSEREAGIRKSIEMDRIGTALSFARSTRTHLVLKGVPTVITTPDGNSYINTTGNPGMATAGAGDVLTGMIAAFLGQRLEPRDASIAGVYLHGLAGDIAARKKGEASIIASDLIRVIPEAFGSLKRHG